jgi:hypothetical protein
LPLSPGADRHHGGIDRHDAYALSSMGPSFRVMQWASPTGSAHSLTPPRTIDAVIPEPFFAERISGAIAAPMRPSP